MLQVGDITSSRPAGWSVEHAYSRGWKWAAHTLGGGAWGYMSSQDEAERRAREEFDRLWAEFMTRAEDRPSVSVTNVFPAFPKED